MLKLSRWERLTLILVIANAASVFFFRFFITLDGPMHVLHACVWKAHLFSDRYATAAVDYLVNPGTCDLSDLLLVPLTWALSPVWAHAAYASLVLLCIGMGAWCSARAAGMKNPLLLLAVLPVLFSHVFVLGFFTFLLAAGMALLFFAWWIGQERFSLWAGCIAVLFILACQATHRAGAPLAILFAGTYEVLLFIRDREAWHKRWTIVPGPLRIAMFGGVALAAAWKVAAALSMRWDLRIAGPEASWPGAFAWRPFLLFSADGERMFFLLLVVLLVTILLIAAVHRLRLRTAPLAADGLCLAGLALMVGSIAFDTPNARYLMLDVRVQTVALIALLTWAAIITPRSWWSTALCLCVLAVHVVRITYAERVMAGSRTAYQQAMAVKDQLPLHGVVLPVVRDDNWLHGHLSALVAASYPGVFFSPHDHLGFDYVQPPSKHLALYANGYQLGLPWLEAHVVANAPPVIDHVVLFGHGLAPDANTLAIMKVVQRHYFLEWSNGYAEVWGRKMER